ncbi:DRTGG domain-containing protein [Prolixibacteraceae bacterium Z1-6]|uniref:DRTGG domain-containing protein n=1 Tax=Draconibacterium aestuarii TaxID=2998507 RepID=A0A9X3F4K0_9BACT|nr:DRTGG domain-containing protein [Prolixibacteraceae bacterium Z1-6]
MQTVIKKEVEMLVSDLVEKFGLKVFSGEEGLENEVNGGYVSDLLSDVMGNAAEGEVWITLQTHQNVMAIASLKDLAAVILVKGTEPEDDTLERSNEEGIPVLGTNLSTFEIAGKLYSFIS